ncbi:MAG: TatD family hydrolase [Patescibacteria group bacterium]|nr:TatD family hydrolase [Patescibacteria group bacterium]
MDSTKIKIIDSHAHLNFEAFNKDRDKVIEDSHKKGVGMINVGSAFDTSRKAVEIAQDYSRGIWAAIGVHPIHVLDEDFSQEAMRDLACNNERVVAIGETGLDYFHLNSKKGRLKTVAKAGQVEKIKDKQKKVLLSHLKLARTLDLPLIFHCRCDKNMDAHYDMLEVLEEFSVEHNDFFLKGVMHCYTGNEEFAKIYLKLGLYLGWTGIITFSSDYDEIIRQVPLERILIETDCPYLSPEIRRGERNVPANVWHVAGKIAQVKGERLGRVIKQTRENARNLFGLDV